jgi:serine/threonine-protein kinase
LAEATKLVIGRYAIFDIIAAGGMATVHYGRLLGAVGFSRTVAIKRLHPQYARDPDFVAMFVDEARLAARIHHPNIVPILDVVTEASEVFLVMEYVKGESISRLLRASTQKGLSVAPEIAGTVMAAALRGLHAAHEARGEHGEPLAIVHRDVTPQNILVGLDGVTRVLDFGVAKASNRLQATTRDGAVKGKIAYMPPEQMRGQTDRRTDVYAASVVLWEMLTARRLFQADNELELLTKVSKAEVQPPSAFAKVPGAVDAIVLKGLARDPDERWQTAQAMAEALEDALPTVATAKIGAWVDSLVSDTLTARSKRIEEIESESPASALTSPQMDVPTDLGSAVSQARGLTRRRKVAPVLIGLGIVALVIAAIVVRQRGTSEGAREATRTTATPTATVTATATETPIVRRAEPTATTAAPPPAVSSAPAPTATATTAPRRATPKPTATSTTNVYEQM